MGDKNKREKLSEIGVPPVLIPSALTCIEDLSPLAFVQETSSSGILIASRDKGNGEIFEFFFFYLTASTWEMVNHAPVVYQAKLPYVQVQAGMNQQLQEKQGGRKRDQARRPPNTQK